MKWFKDGDQVVVTRDDFVDLQESPAVFVPESSPTGQTISQQGIRYLPLNDLVAIRDQLDSGGGDFYEAGFD